MMYVGFSGDQRVHADVLDSIEAGMAIALYLPTGARGSELKRMHLQSLGHESIQDERSGITFECLKLTAFQTKTKAQHLNQILPHSNPWRCGVGLLGLILLRRIMYGAAPPFKMQTTEHSWKIVGTNVDTLDPRIKAVFQIASVRRQHGDPRHVSRAPLRNPDAATCWWQCGRWSGSTWPLEWHRILPFPRVSSP